MLSGIFKIASYRPRLYFIGIMFLAMTSGTALNLVIFTIPYQLSEAGYPTHAVGAMFLTGLPYCFKPVWGPFIDKYSIPFLCPYFGQRRGWAIAGQIGLILSVSSLLLIDPATNLFATAVTSFTITCFAAILDIILDAYRIERSSTPELLSNATAFGVMGMRFGMLISSAGALIISYGYGWDYVYMAELALTLIGPIVILCVAEPSVKLRQVNSHMLSFKEYFRTIIEGLVILKAQQPKLLIVMVMVLLYKVSDSVPMSMSSALFMDLSYNSYEIASIYKGYGFFVMILGCVVGGILSSKIGIKKNLLLCGTLQLLAPIMFMILSIIGYNIIVFTITITIQNLVSGLAVTALSIYLSDICGSKLVATQFSIISAFNSLARIILSSFAGVVATYIDWTAFFGLTLLLGSIFIIIFRSIDTNI